MPYHLNPETGQPGFCRASIRPCPFGLPGDHFATVLEARVAYEGYMAGSLEKPLSWLFTPKNTTLRATEDHAGLTRSCFEEAEAFRAHWPLKEENTKWPVRDVPYGMGYYSMGGFAPINAILRGHELDYYDEPVDEERRELVLERISELEDCFKVAPTDRLLVYRYTNLRDLAAPETLEQLEQTGEFHDLGYMSTSASMDFPLIKVLQKPEKGRVLLEIAIDGPYIPMSRDAEVSPGDVQSHENEILLPRGQRFQVAGIDRRRHCEVGDLKNTYLNKAPWSLTAAERKLLKMTEARVPLVRMVQVRQTVRELQAHKEFS